MADPITPVKDPIPHPLTAGGKPSPSGEDLPTNMKWFADAVEADRLKRKAAAVDILFEHTDGLLREGRFREVDHLLRLTPTEGPSLTFLIGLLSITLPASQHLPARQPLFDRVWQVCVARGRNADKLLGGLRQWSTIDGTGPCGR